MAKIEELNDREQFLINLHSSESGKMPINSGGTGMPLIKEGEIAVNNADGKLYIVSANGSGLTTFVDKSQVESMIGSGVTELSAASEVTMSIAASATSGYLKTYIFAQGGNEIGKVDIPKDLVVTSGKIVKGTWSGDTFTEDEAGKDKALKLTIANQSAPVYINVKDLCDVYTPGSAITISDTNVISVKDNVFDLSGAAQTVKEEVTGTEASSTSAETSLWGLKKALEEAKSLLDGKINTEASARSEGDLALLGDSAATTTTGNTIMDLKRALAEARASLVREIVAESGDTALIKATKTSESESGDTYTIESTTKLINAISKAENALQGIAAGKESGVSVNEDKELDFSELSINCGEF